MLYKLTSCSASPRPQHNGRTYDEDFAHAGFTELGGEGFESTNIHTRPPTTPAQPNNFNARPPAIPFNTRPPTSTEFQSPHATQGPWLGNGFHDEPESDPPLSAPSPADQLRRGRLRDELGLGVGAGRGGDRIWHSRPSDDDFSAHRTPHGQGQEARDDTLHCGPEFPVPMSPRTTNNYSSYLTSPMYDMPVPHREYSPASPPAPREVPPPQEIAPFPDSVPQSQESYFWPGAAPRLNSTSVIPASNSHSSYTYDSPSRSATFSGTTSHAPGFPIPQLPSFH